MSKQARGMIQFRLIPHPKKSGTLFAHINFTPRFLSLAPFFARPVPTTAPRPSLPQLAGNPRTRRPTISLPSAMQYHKNASMTGTTGTKKKNEGGNRPCVRKQDKGRGQKE